MDQCDTSLTLNLRTSQNAADMTIRPPVAREQYQNQSNSTNQQT